MGSQNSLTPSQHKDYIFQLAVTTSQQKGREICFAAKTSGLLHSKDGGKTWGSAYASLNTDEALPTMAIALSPDFNHEPTVFAGLNGTILRSYDGGINWQTSRLPAPPPAITTLVISPSYVEDGIVFASTREDGVLVSNDRGNTWVSWNFGLLDLNILCLAISPNFATDETLFAGTESGLFRSTNGGRAWREVSLPFGFDAVLSLALSKYFAQNNTIFIGTENNGLFVSQDRGKLWQSFNKSISDQPINAIHLSPTSPIHQEILILYGGELRFTTDGGKTWKNWHSAALAAKVVTAILIPQGLNAEAMSWVGCADGSILRL